MTPRFAAIDARQRHARPEGDRLGAQDLADIDGALQEGDAAGTALRMWGQQRRLMLAAGIEQEARTGLDDATEAAGVQIARQRLRALDPAILHRIKIVVVKRQCDAVVARDRDQRDRIG